MGDPGGPPFTPAPLSPPGFPAAAYGPVAAAAVAAARGSGREACGPAAPRHAPCAGTLTARLNLCGCVCPPLSPRPGGRGEPHGGAVAGLQAAGPRNSVTQKGEVYFLWTSDARLAAQPASGRPWASPWLLLVHRASPAPPRVSDPAREALGCEGRLQAHPCVPAPSTPAALHRWACRPS